MCFSDIHIINAENAAFRMCQNDLIAGWATVKMA